MNDLISVLVLCYNHERFVKDCLRSICEQTYDNIELIILDNASQDASVKEIETLLAQYEGRFRRVVLIKNKENAGICKGENQMLRIAEGKYIMMASSDDILDLEAIQNLKVCLESNEECGLIVGNGYYVNEDYHFGENPQNYGGKLIYVKQPDFSGNYMCRLLERNNIAAPAVMLKGSVFSQIGYFDEKMAYEDWEYWLRVVKNGGKIGYCNCNVVFYRRGSQSISYMQKGHKDTEEKLTVYYRHNIAILEMYGDCVTEKELAEIYKRIYEKYLQKGMEVASPKFVKLVFREGEQKKVSIAWKSKVKYLLFCLGLYKK